ncbi:MAG: hypothetical protein OXN17_10460 [Candidatus Poribacteria bacterium]|nr:hypothetical protein [Candidatus Poribacteria bacterium]MDE0504304.1 hypothetical protein [Candidatus Poribacteria bacterium]
MSIGVALDEHFGVAGYFVNGGKDAFHGVRNRTGQDRKEHEARAGFFADEQAVKVGVRHGICKTSDKLYAGILSSPDVAVKRGKSSGQWSVTSEQ